VIGIHHPPKHDAEGSRGSSVLPGKVDRHYTISRDGDLLTLKPVKVRNAPSDTFTLLASLVADPLTGALRTVNFYDGHARKQAQEMERVQDEILEVLAVGPMNVRTLRARVKARSELLTVGLSVLVGAGLVVMKAGPRKAKLYELASR